MLDCAVLMLQPHADKSIGNIKFKYEISIDRSDSGGLLLVCPNVLCTHI